MAWDYCRVAPITGPGKHIRRNILVIAVTGLTANIIILVIHPFVLANYVGNPYFGLLVLV